jgi:hypothetical protein
MSKQDWNVLSAVGTIGGVIVAIHGYRNSRGWSDAHTAFMALSIFTALGPQVQNFLDGAS